MHLWGMDHKCFSPHCCKCNSFGCTATIRCGNACHGPHSDSVYSGSEHSQFNSPRLVKREANYDALLTHHTTENTHGCPHSQTEASAPSWTYPLQWSYLLQKSGTPSIIISMWWFESTVSGSIWQLLMPIVATWSGFEHLLVWVLKCHSVLWPISDSCLRIILCNVDTWVLVSTKLGVK